MSENPALAGTVQLHSSLQIGYFQQSQVEEISAQEKGTPLSYMQVLTRRPAKAATTCTSVHEQRLGCTRPPLACPRHCPPTGRQAV